MWWFGHSLASCYPVWYNDQPSSVSSTQEYFINACPEAGEMAQWLTAPAALAEVQF